ncbi:TPA: pyocin knob domain-containing protein [Klebsiella michiganensis]
MSENNYGALMMKSSLSAAIDINTIVLPGIYPIPSDNTSSPDPNGGVLIVHSGTVKQRTFTSKSIISACSYYDDTTSKWSEWLLSVSQSALAATDGLKLVGGFGFVSPQMFGGISGNPDTDNTAPVMSAISEAVSKGLGLDLRGGPWRVTRTLDMTYVKHVIADYSGRILVDPENFISAHNNNYAITFGNPDTIFRDDRCNHTCVAGTLFVLSDNRNALLNGVFIKGALLNIGAIRATNFNGYGIRLGAVWDTTVSSLSSELCGNITTHALAIDPFNDTSNCLNIGRIQCERAYHKGLRVNVIRSEIHNIHAERLYILTTNDGATGLPSGLNYENSYFLLSNSEISHMILDAMDSSSEGTVTTTPSVRLSLYASHAATLAMGTCIVTSTYGLASTIDNSNFYKYYNNLYPVTLTSCQFTSQNSDGLLQLGGSGSVAINCVADTIKPDYNTTKLLLSSCTINNAYSNTRTNVSGVLFDACTFNNDIKETGPTEVKEPTEFRNCTVKGSIKGYFQQRFIMNGGYAESIDLVSRAYADLRNVSGNVFNPAENGDRAYITKHCKFNTVTRWGPPAFGVYKIGERTQRIGALGSGSVIEYVNTSDQGAEFKAAITI